ncbi:MAG TPA: M20/M25/M40 family metallo-hydrolase, partial [Longimicrobiaceae bacterium]|nr:M20/M25/M40 family metallo-hydrolase [Longimicrobiaceae bacterium]
AHAQRPSLVLESVVSWQELDAPPGHEALATTLLQPALQDWRRDAHGNLVLRRGEGRPRRVVACAIDRPGYAVTQITENGYLRLHRVGVGSHPLWDQAHEGQQVEILTAAGVVPGVTAIANGHFAPQHRADTTVVTADELWVDVGAGSRAEAEALGIAVLDPVQRRIPAWRYADAVAGPAVGARAGCAAVAAAARGEVSSGETVFLITTQSAFGWPGLGAALARLGPVDAVTVVGPGQAMREAGWRRTGSAAGVHPAVLRIARADSLRVLTPQVRFPGTLVESISASEAEWLLTEVARAANVTSLPTSPWVVVPSGERRPDPRTNDPHAETSALLRTLADLPGAPGDEWRVRDAVRERLPSWAQARAQVDSAGNLVVAVGPERDTVVFIAHLDEVAWDVDSILPDGMVTLRRRGGAIPSAWEGQPALLHLGTAAGGSAPASLPGVFVPRDSACVKQPERVLAWFGMDAAALAARGVRVGQSVTAHKEAVRLAGSRFTGRAMDDRAGTTALLLAMRQIDPAKLPRKVIFVWSTEEEIGLFGATALAAELGPTVRRVYSVDTFVSSDTPLESPHFAHAPLGQGPVLRAAENSSIAPPEERARVMAIARAAGIPLQIGLTQGGTDGTAFTFWGAPNAGLSWPGRYSHSPAEVLDLGDLEQLAALITAVATSPE